MTKNLTDQQLMELSKQSLNDSISTLENSVTLQLQKSRKLALQQHKPTHFYQLQWVGGMVTALLLISVVWFNIKQPASNMEDDLLLLEDIIYSEENQDLLNNLEFYKWLEEHNTQGELV